MSGDHRRLSVYFGERDRVVGDGLLATALGDLFERSGLELSVVLRGAEGFGVKHQRRTDRLLTLSEDLPVVAEALGAPEEIERAAAAAAELLEEGLITVAPTHLTRAGDFADAAWAPGRTHTKLSLYVGRRERLRAGPAYREAIAALRECGVDGATALLGVDGTVSGIRRRAAFVGANSEVPIVVISVGATEPIAQAAAKLGELLPAAPMTLEDVRILKRDGALLAEPETAVGGNGGSERLTVYAGEQSRHGGHALYRALMRELRSANAPGATTLRGIWGYHGDHEPHGDTLWSVRRRVPVVTTTVVPPGLCGRTFEIFDAATNETGLVTAEHALEVRLPGGCDPTLAPG